MRHTRAAAFVFVLLVVAAGAAALPNCLPECSGSDLRDADLRGAYLSGTDMSDADLRGTDLRGAVLDHADLRGAFLTGADLRGVTVHDSRGPDLRGAVMPPES